MLVPSFSCARQEKRRGALSVCSMEARLWMRTMLGEGREKGKFGMWMWFLFYRGGFVALRARQPIRGRLGWIMTAVDSPPCSAE